jgi:Cu(I)/Ag(I) efflux system protein CusF
MKIAHPLLVVLFLAACSSQSDTTPATTAASDAASIWASGVVTAVDPAAGTITIDHGPVASLQWPAMTMTFKAPSIDLKDIKPGDHVQFEPTADGTIMRLERK